MRRSLALADHTDKISCLGARQLFDHALAGPLPLLQEDQEIGHLLPVRPLVELLDDVGADLAGGGQDAKEIPTRRWSQPVSDASRILPKHLGASVSAAWPGRAAGPAPPPPRGGVGGSARHTLWCASRDVLLRLQRYLTTLPRAGGESGQCPSVGIGACVDAWVGQGHFERHNIPSHCVHPVLALCWLSIGSRRSGTEWVDLAGRCVNHLPLLLELQNQSAA
jgi:hypothetical protein